MNMMIPQEPAAYAKISGSSKYPGIQGTLTIYDTYGGSILMIEIADIAGAGGEKENGFLGLHIHEGSSCSGSQTDPFADAGGHDNPQGRPHPQHAGDLPPLLVNEGAAWMMVYTGRFYPEDVVGKTVIVHGMPDDFHSQPSGDSGEKIACGEIKEWEMNTAR